jgi:nitric oxide reductase subunit B
MNRQVVWKTRMLAFSFWSINLGLALMVLLSLLPIGLMQAWASMEHGMWFARSAEFLQTPLMNNLRWLRVIGDVIFALGALGLVWFIAGLKTGWSLAGTEKEQERDLPADALAGASFQKQAR